jgi:hypothetical protein
MARLDGALFSAVTAGGRQASAAAGSRTSVATRLKVAKVSVAASAPAASRKM